jgi:hypothetical protein
LRLVAGRLQGVRDVRRDLLDRLHVDERPNHRTRLELVDDLHRSGGLGGAPDPAEMRDSLSGLATSGKAML